jgi:hypothetical protein
MDAAMWTRCAFGLWGLLTAALPGFAGAAQEQEVYVPLAKNLSADGQLAAEKGVPVLMLMADAAPGA